MAALRAADAGLSVALVEKSELLGGTTSISGGTLWVACSPPMLAGGADDSPEAALEYLTSITRGRHPEPLLRAVVESGPEMIAFADGHGLRFRSVLNYPDYRQDLPGASRGGRSLDPYLYDASGLGDLRDAIRPDPRLPFTMEEYEAWGAFTKFPWAELERRKADGLTARGGAVAHSLIAALAARDVSIWTDASLEELLVEQGRVAGARIGDRTIRARRGVVIATGGFEWNDAMLAQFVSAPFIARCSPPHNTGDGIRAGALAGAQVRNMHEAWWAPYAQLSGDATDGSPTATLLRFERQGPGSIIVDRNGRRFVNESQNYNDLTRAMHAHDPRDHGPARLPAWVVVDDDYVQRYGLFSFRSGEPVPEWLRSGETLADLAGALDVPATDLEATVARFNGFAAAGVDEDYRRGESAYDRYWGDADRGLPNPCLAPLAQGPFYAFEALPGGFGTCGGLATDADARVLDWRDEPIAGLFAVGNTSAHPVGGGYPGAGATLGPGMTMGFRAGSALIADALVDAPGPAVGAR
jgi:3-oxosteroid 1-dehydrogenase